MRFFNRRTELNDRLKLMTGDLFVRLLNLFDCYDIRTSQLIKRLVHKTTTLLSAHFYLIDAYRMM